MATGQTKKNIPLDTPAYGIFMASGARTFYCHSCQCEKSVAIKVRLGRNVVRCRDCVDAGKVGRGKPTNSLYSREFNRWLDQDARGFIPYDRPVIDQGIREAYAATRAADGD